MPPPVTFAKLTCLALLAAGGCTASPAVPAVGEPLAAPAAGRAAGRSGRARASGPAAAAVPTTPAATPVVTPTAGAAVSSAGSAESAGSAVPATPACPADMQLVDGSYCTEVRQQCLSFWWDSGHFGKQVCERFAAPAVCVGPLVRKRFCIDTYEWPNIPGERPEVMNTFYQAQIKCAAVGKRLCTKSEWTFACEGPQLKPFPYGYERDARKCNGDHRWDSPNNLLVLRRDPAELARLWRGVPSGTQPGCVSDFGVADLTGNLDEIVVDERFRGSESVHTGGHWYYGVRNQCRPKIYAHNEHFYWYFVGFRCCAAADGERTEPVTLGQQKRGKSLRFAEHWAGFTVEQMRRKLELKQTGSCTCEPADLLCRTMCGTLLGPGAVDGDDSTRMRRPEPRPP